MRRFLIPLKGLFSHEGGNVAVIVAFVFLPLLVIAGGATDIARHEAYRVTLQDGVDRAVLAAASLTQVRPVEDTVRDYLKTIDFIDDVALTFDSSNTLSRRQVTVTARYEMATAFLPLIGINTISVRAAGAAVEKRSNVELSLMLDFSGSMVGSKYTRLKSAATEFIDAILTEQSKATTTISIVPYAGQVNVGASLFNRLVNLAGFPARREHTNSSCFEMRNNSDFGTGLISFVPRAQVPHFTVWNATNYSANLNPAWCPSDDTSIAFMSNNAAFLKQRIADYRMYDGTGTAIAMNWGYMLLDPSSAPLMSVLQGAGTVLPQFSGRPAAFDDPETVKFLVLMTDGLITEQYTAKDKTKPVRTANNYSEISNRNTNRDRLYKVCDAAKDNDVIVFTIGFEITNVNDQDEMRNCASSPSHFFAVSGLDISNAFRTIAASIHKVRLTQ